ncbi:aminopeptidase [bacterium]|nr:aminopeptidase [Bacteroides sp.]MBD5387584.1 aminopeptidase [bacterium]MDE6255565.1 C1 family peptidase [Muribaculaceae bacterium]
MKKYSFALAALLACSPFAGATYFEAPACDEPGVENPDSTGFKFTEVITIPTTSVKDQNKSGTCWAFSGLSTLEDNVLKNTGKEIDLSEMFVVRNAYIDKAKKYMRMNGKLNFAQGGSFADVLEMTRLYGAVPEEAYSGLNYGESKHSHYEMAEALEAYLNAVLARGMKNSKLSSAWLPGFIGILDAYLGKAPENFTYNGKNYTPQSFAKEMGIVPENFQVYTSYTHHPFYEDFVLEIPDNWLWSTCRNVPMNELQAICDNALENGYSVMWAADVSEGGFKWRKGYAVLPDDKDQKDMTDTELSRWVKLSDKDRENAKFEIKGPVKEKTVTQESRQQTFDNYETTDDHGMVIVGTATDQEGNKYYKVKNSWDTNQIYDGFFYVSVPYFLEKTLNIGVHKDAVPKDIAKKFK